MAKKSVEEQQERVKSLENLTIPELKNNIVQTCIRQSKAESELQDYKDSYKAVIDEEKEMRQILLFQLARKEEIARLTTIQENWEEEKGVKLEAVR